MWQLQLLLLASASLWGSQASSWDRTNILRLFSDSEKIFSHIKLEPEEELCVNQFQNFVNDVKINREWALEVIDSWSREPAGLHSGVDFDSGHFDQCVSQYEKHFHHHCLVKVKNEQKFSFDMAVCLPRTCSESTAFKLTKPLFKSLGVEVSQVLKCHDGSRLPFGGLERFTLALVAGLILVSLAATFYDLRGGQGIFQSFSLRRNINQLAEIRSDFGPMSCLNGLRVASMTWIVLFHTYEVFYSETVKKSNKPDIEAFHRSFWRFLISGGQHAVDTFFVIGGLLVAHSFLRERQNRANFNALKYVLHRWIRLVPVFAFITLVLVTFSAHLSGLSQETSMVDNCTKYWWSSLLLVQNLVNPSQMCITESWYIQVDFQLYLLSPFLLFPLAKFGRKVLPVFALLALGSALFTFSTIMAKNFHFNFIDELQWHSVYAPTMSRFGPWVTGMALGHLLFQPQELLTKGTRLALWGLSAAVSFGVFYIPFVQVRQNSETVLGFALFQSLHRPLWSLAVAWVIFACVRGYAGPLNWLLSMPFFQPLNRLSYSVYIMHFPLIVFTALQWRSLQYFSPYLVVLFLLGIMTLSLILSIPVVLLVELPVANLERKFWRRRQQHQKVT